MRSSTSGAAAPEEPATETGSGEAHSWGAFILFASTIFCGAFLLFQVQLVIGKILLPWFGGAPAVWATCLVAFQVLLLGGYAYSHLVSTRLSPRAQVRLHGALLAATIVLLAVLGNVWRSPLIPGDAWKPSGETNPAAAILRLLAISVAPAFLLLSTTAPLLQKWFAGTGSSVSPYRLYAVSNAGSLLGLLTYPLLVEPCLTLTAQTWSWSAAYACFCAGVFACSRYANVARAKAGDALEPMEVASPPGRGDGLLWAALSACGSFMLVATTNLVCSDIAVVPMLWVAPLGLYLLTWIIAFRAEHPYPRGFVNAAFFLLLPVAATALGAQLSVKTLILLFSAVLFVICLVCHGEVARLRPSPRHLTAYYLMTSVGGAVGALLVTVVAPFVFRGYWEFHLGLIATAVLVLVVLWRDPESWLRRAPGWVPFAAFVVLTLSPELLRVMKVLPRGDRVWTADRAMVAVAAMLLATALLQRSLPLRPRMTLSVLSCGVLVCAAIVVIEIRAESLGVVGQWRNFYGTVRVKKDSGGGPSEERLLLVHGRTLHGAQFTEPSQQLVATTYFGPGSGAEIAISGSRRELRGPLRIGVIGLGVGTVAAHCRPGDLIRFYEINPRIVSLATGPGALFSFATRSGTVETVLGDARISMERELADGRTSDLDVLIVDAFTSDAIPVHLLTREAFEVYLRRLGATGIIAVNISNRMLDLAPPLRAVARQLQVRHAIVDAPATGPGTTRSRWVLLSRSATFPSWPELDRKTTNLDDVRQSPVWTDDYSNIVMLML